MATEIFSIVGKIALDGSKAVTDGLKKVDDGAKKVKSTLETTGKKMQDFGTGMVEAGKTMTAAITVPVLAAGGLSVKAASDFESAFAGVRKTVNATEQQLAMLEEGIRDMSKEMPQSAAEIAGIAEAAGQLGIKTDNILGFTKTMAMLGDSTNLSSEEAATALARLANITGMPQTEFDKLGSTIVALGNNFATTESEITEMSMRLAGTGAQIGMNEAQIMGLAAAMSSVGINAEAGGSSMSAVMKDISVAVANGGKDLAGFAKISGMSSQAFADAFNKDPMSAIVSFIGGLDKAAGSGENMTLMLKELGITGILETDTLARLAGAHEVLADAQGVAAKGWEENSALSNEAEQRYKTFASQLGIFKNRITDIAITFGSVLLPVILMLMDKMQPFIDYLEGVAEKFAAMDPKMQMAILAFVAIAAAIPPLIVALGTLVNTTGGAMLVFQKLGGALSFIASPAGIILAAVLALAAGLVFAYQKSESFRNAVNNTFATLAPIVMSGLSAAANFIRTIWGSVTAWWTANGQMILQALSNVFNFMLPIVQFVMVGLMNTISMYWGIIKTIFSGALNMIMGLVTLFGAIFTGNWSKAWESVKQIFSGALQFVWGLIQLWLVGKVLAVIGGFIGRFLGYFRSLGSQAGSLVSSLVTRVTGFFTNMGSRIASTASNMVTRVIGFFSNMSSRAGVAMSQLRTTATNIFNGARDAIMNPIRTATTFVKTQIDKILGFFADLKGKFKFPKIDIPIPKIDLTTGSKTVLGKKITYPTGFDVSWYDKGGIFDSPSIIGVGERRPEFVGALDDLRKIVREEAGTGMAGSLTVEVPVYLDGYQIARASAPHIQTEIQRREQQDARNRGRRTL